MDANNMNAQENIVTLADACNKQYQVELRSQLDYFKERDSMDFTFTSLAYNRSTSCCHQFWLLFKRNMVFAWRNPKSIRAFFVMTIVQAFLMCAIFEDVAASDYDFKTPLNKFARPKRRLKVHLQNVENLRFLHGFTFYCASDQFISIAIGQVLHMPVLWPVYVRERSSRMYGVGAYFMASWCASTLCYLIFQPLIYATATFFSIGMKDVSYENYLMWLFVLTVQGINGSTFGFSFGAMIADPILCILISYFFLVLIYFGGGAFTNYNGQANAL